MREFKYRVSRSGLWAWSSVEDTRWWRGDGARVPRCCGDQPVSVAGRCETRSAEHMQGLRSERVRFSLKYIKQ